MAFSGNTYRFPVGPFRSTRHERRVADIADRHKCLRGVIAAGTAILLLLAVVLWCQDLGFDRVETLNHDIESLCLDDRCLRVLLCDRRAVRCGDGAKIPELEFPVEMND